MKKILLADDNVIIRNGLIKILQELIPIVNFDEAWESQSAFSMVVENFYDVIIIDQKMDRDSGTLVENLLKVKPGSNILILSTVNEEIFARRYLRLGVMGYISKSSALPEIKNAIVNVLNNKKYISSTLLEDLTHDVFSENSQNPFDRLSKREREIVALMLKGNRGIDISQALQVEESTVGTYKERILKKLDCLNVLDINSLAGLYHFSPG